MVELSQPFPRLFKGRSVKHFCFLFDENLTFWSLQEIHQMSRFFPSTRWLLYCVLPVRPFPFCHVHSEALFSSTIEQIQYTSGVVFLGKVLLDSWPLDCEFAYEFLFIFIHVHADGTALSWLQWRSRLDGINNLCNISAVWGLGQVSVSEPLSQFLTRQ